MKQAHKPNNLAYTNRHIIQPIGCYHKSYRHVVGIA